MSRDPAAPADPRSNNSSGNPFDSGLPMVGRPPDDSEPVNTEEFVWNDWLDTPKKTPADPEPSTASPSRPEPVHLQKQTGHSHSHEENPFEPTIIDRSGPGSGPWLSGRRARSTGGSWWFLLLGVTAAVAAVAVIITLTSTRHPRPATSPTTPPATPAAPDLPQYASDGCVQNPGTTPGSVVSGTNPGGTTSGPDAVLGFEHAYYVDRDGHRARTFTTPDAAVPDGDSIARGIAKVPQGTRYCVWIAPSNTPDGSLRVDLTEQYPGEKPETFPQIIHTTTRDGRTLITKIEPASS